VLTRRNGTKPREKRAPVRSKYKNARTEIDGILFASKAEAQYYVDLKLALAEGKIAHFERQVPFTLQERYVSPSTGRVVRPMVYISDFVITGLDGDEAIVDVKGASGYQTEVFKIKKKLFEPKFGPLWVEHKFRWPIPKPNTSTR
jgi:hypothetical protein